MKKTPLILSIFSLLLTSCSPKKPTTSNQNRQDYPTEERTSDIGFTYRTQKRKNASDKVRIRLITDKVVRKRDSSPILMESYDEMDFDGTLSSHDHIELSSDYCYITLSLFGMEETVVYSPHGLFLFEIPDEPTSNVPQPYDYDKLFKKTSYHFSARVSTAKEIQKSRNLALNPYDCFYQNERNEYTAKTEELLSDSPCLKDGSDEILGYPHAYANRVTENKPIFYARNAIDGNKLTGNNHYKGNYQSWGCGKNPDSAFSIYFGRKVKLNRLVFTLRNDQSETNGLRHDTYWESFDVVFSNGTRIKMKDFVFTGQPQERELVEEVETDSIRLENFKVHDSGKGQGWAALSEIEAYGKDTKTENLLAEKKTVITSFGKNKMTVKTDKYHSQDIKDFIEKVFRYSMLDPDYGTEKGNYHNGSIHQDCYQRGEHTRNNVIGDYGCNWQDSVFYHGLMDAYMTIGNEDIMYYLKDIGSQFGYKVNKDGSYTNHADWYTLGETFLLMDELEEGTGRYRSLNAISNADTLIKKNRSTNNGFNYSSPKGSMNYWWCDALYMGMNTMTLLGELFEKDYVQDAYDGYAYWKDILYNKEDHLWNRDKATGEFEVRSPSGEITYWSRGNAWVISALAKQLVYLDEETYPDIYEAYKEDLVDLATALKDYQREDGTWNAAICSNGWEGLDGKETTGTAGFLYALSIGIGLGVLDYDAFFPVAEKAYQALTETCVIKDDENGIKIGYMQTVGKRCDTYQSEDFSRNHTNTFGTGLVLMSASAFMRLCKDYTIPEVESIPDVQGSVIQTIREE